MKGIFSQCAIVLILIFGSVSIGAAIVDRIVAIVNQEVITLSEVEKWSRPLQQEIEATDRLEKREKANEVSRQVLEKLVEEKLIDQEAKRSGIKVSSKEVESALDEIKRRNASSQEEMEKALANEGLSLEAFKQQIEKKLLRTRLVSWTVKVEPKVGEKELFDFYQKNIDRYQSHLSYRPSHILFVAPKELKPEEVGEIRRKCQQVLEKIRKGEDFGEMALLYSQDASSKDRGDLGYFKKGELLPAFEKEAVRLQAGEVSGIIRTQFGFHIIKLLDRKGGGPTPFEEVREKVQADYYEKEMEKAFNEFLSKLKEKSVIEIKL
jgi:peptidyl-prolyl cis-trans isomerase SurA